MSKPAMKLPRETLSLWLDTVPGRRFPALQRDLKVDVAVVGGGITGITAATLLRRAGKSVAVLEARRIGQGVTGGTTAHLTEALDASYASLTKDFGQDGARLATEASRAALERIALFVQEGRIACSLRRVPAFAYTESKRGVAAIEEEYDAAVRLGVPVTLVRDTPLPFKTPAALRYDNQGRFHVRRYLMPMANALRGTRGHVFEGTRVLDVEDGEPCRVITESGVVTAKEVVIATHVPMKAKWVMPKLAQYRSYVVAFTLKGEVPDGLFWDDDDPYHYVRLQETKEGTVLIAGGEDHKVGQEEDTEARYASVAEWAQERFPVKKAAWRWSAQVVETVDGLPYYGRPGGSPHVFACTGYSGTGMTFGTLGGMMAADAILGRENALQKLFAYNRVKPLASAKDLVAENVDFPAHFVGDRLAAPERRGFAGVPRGAGCIVEENGERLAVYRDPKGGVHARSAVCTHMGCLVGWNDAEKSWDCPCHGSRFDPDGEVLDGPAVAPLALPKQT